MGQIGSLFDTAGKLRIWFFTILAGVMIWGLAEWAVQKWWQEKPRPEKTQWADSYFQDLSEEKDNRSSGAIQPPQGMGIEIKDFSRTNVKRLQQALKNAGYNPGSVDGKMGPKTKKALAHFKKARQLPQTSVIDLETLQALEPYF